MFKVSLLPDSYRRRLQSRQKIEIISEIALVILVCLFIVYAGVSIKNQVLQSKLSKLRANNAELEAKFPELQEYQNIYNDLQAARNIVTSITPKDMDAVEFFTKVSEITNKTPFVQMKEVDIENWFTDGVCNLTCVCQDYSDMKDYKALFETEEMKEVVKLVEVTSIERKLMEDGSRSVQFVLTLSINSGANVEVQDPVYVQVTDENGETVTNSDGEAQTTDIANTTQAAEAQSGAAETTTAAEEG